jgi:cytochrome c peroxidase
LLILVLVIATPATFAADVVLVSQSNRRFSPDHLSIVKGATLHVVNDDRVTHHIYVDSPGMAFDSGEQPVGKSVDLRFDKSGRFLVRCAIHPIMRLDVTVE